jgi:hypothetical protein
MAKKRVDAPNFDGSGAIGTTGTPTVRLAHVGPPKAIQKALSDPDKMPALLCSYYYLKVFLKNRHLYQFRDWVMDSGAFSAHNSGKVIDLQQYIDTCLQLMETDEKLTEIFALDVIGDHEATLKNTEEMHRQGVPAIPCYHAGEPEEYLMHIAKEYDKIALGGVARVRDTKRRIKWAEQCFARVWPKKIHGFGFGLKSDALALPWHSVDASSWELGPTAFGTWSGYSSQGKGQYLPVRGSEHNLKIEIDRYLKIERQARIKWKSRMQDLGPDSGGVSCRLACISKRVTKALS